MISTEQHSSSSASALSVRTNGQVSLCATCTVQCQWSEHLITRTVRSDFLRYWRRALLVPNNLEQPRWLLNDSLGLIRARTHTYHTGGAQAGATSHSLVHPDRPPLGTSFVVPPPSPIYPFSSSEKDHDSELWKKNSIHPCPRSRTFKPPSPNIS